MLMLLLIAVKPMLRVVMHNDAYPVPCRYDNGGSVSAVQALSGLSAGGGGGGGGMRADKRTTLSAIKVRLRSAVFVLAGGVGEGGGDALWEPGNKPLNGKDST